MSRLGLSSLCLLGALSIPSVAFATKSSELYTSAASGYGRFEARMRYAAGDGVVSAFFLWKDGSEKAGTFWNELDYEKIDADCKIQTNALYGNPSANHTQRPTVSNDLCDGFHVYAYEWTPDYIAWLLDGTEIRRETGDVAAAYAQNASAGMQVHFNIWPGDVTFGGTLNPSILPVHQYIDWVQFSSYSGGAFTVAWREDFTAPTLPTGWLTGDWASPKNLSTHDALNVNFLGGYAVLSLTSDDAPGPAGAMSGPDVSAGGASAQGGVAGGGGAPLGGGGAPLGGGGGSAGPGSSASGGSAAPSGGGTSPGSAGTAVGSGGVSAGGAAAGGVTPPGSGNPAAGGMTSAAGVAPGAEDSSGCGCLVAGSSRSSRQRGSVAAALALALCGVLLRRRSAARSVPPSPGAPRREAKGRSRRRAPALALVGPFPLVLSVGCGHAVERPGAGSTGGDAPGVQGGMGVGVGGAGAASTMGGVAQSGSGTSSAGSGARSAGTSAGSPGAASAGFVFPAPVAPWQPTQACLDRATQVLAGLTLRQKAGQMIQADTTGAAPADVTTYQFGSVFSGGDSDPPTDDAPQTWRTFVESFEAAASAAPVPLVFAIDAVHGNNNVSNTVVFPHNIGLGATRDTALVTEIGHITALETRGTSIDWTFAPTISPAQDERWGRTFESFSEDPALAAEMAVALVKGLQGDSLGGPESVVACAKHFAGDGATAGGVDQSDTMLDEATFRRLGVDVYQPLINAGVGTIMVSYSSYNGVKMTGNAHWLTDVLKGEMGFRGIIGSDWAAASKLPGDEATQVATAVNAGIDMLMEPYSPGHKVDLLEAAVSATGSANIPMSRIDDAVTRILTIKCEHGMLAPGYAPSGDAALLAEIGSEAHREVARRAVRQSAVLLQNQNDTLPLPQTAHVRLVGSGADSLARQCGGWTVDWQGLGTVATSPGVTTGSTILKGVQAAVGAENVSYSADGSGSAEGATHVVVVLSEAPYAEGHGDVTDLDLATRTPDLPVLQAARATGLPVVAVLLSGRPLIIEPYLALADAWLAAWLPGTEADALADVLFGRNVPTGKLSHTWPKTMAQIPINFGDPDYESDPPLFPLGFGLTY